MKCKDILWEYWRNFEDELSLTRFKESKGKEIAGFDLPLLGEMTMEQFNRHLNTYRWLTLSINSSKLSTKPSKPSQADLLEALGRIHSQGLALQIYANSHSDHQLRSDIRIKARNRILCANHYISLVNKGFFDDK